MSRRASHRSMSRAAYRKAITALKARHPWLCWQVVLPAPGHLGVFADFVAHCELLMASADHKEFALFCATTQRDRLSLHVELADASVSRERALIDLVQAAQHSALQHCPVCSAPVIGGDVNASQGARCTRHAARIGLFSEEMRQNQRLALTAGVPVPTPEAKPAPRAGPSNKEVNDAIDIVMRALPEAAPQTNLDPAGEPLIAFLEDAGLRSFVLRNRARTEEKARRAESMVERIKGAGHERRRLGTLPEDWPQLVEDFRRDFPNFAELAEVLHDNFALHALGDGRVCWPPLLLVGPAGIGKTEAARWLAERLLLPHRVVDMASTQSSSPLAGSESFWTNSEPGVIFELLAYQPKANAVVVLDELDKAGRDRTYDPLAALYTLLEPRSARSFIDLSIRDFAIDASHLNWVATANTTDDIAAPLLSRMTVLRVQAPTASQLRHIAQSIYGRLRAEGSWGAAFSPRLSDDLLDQLEEQPPRSLGLALRRALGRAARAKRDHLLVTDLPASTAPARRGIGFMA